MTNFYCCFLNKVNLEIQFLDFANTFDLYLFPKHGQRYRPEKQTLALRRTRQELHLSLNILEC